MSGTVRNPVLPGFHPDPSVCRVGDDHWLVTSTFEYFPGLPVHHSTDLARWEHVGHAIDRRSQLDLDGVKASGGLFAPTIRHHDGTFWITCTLMHGRTRRGNFVISATDPSGRWSDPTWLPDAEGIDPSLFFDDDGSAWYVGARATHDPHPQHPEQTDIWLRRFDVRTRTLVGPEHVLWHGALRAARWAEGPHLYKVDGRYVLLVAEGGTEQHHAVTVARAEHVTGPYVGHVDNPVLTHRHLGADHPVVGVGHADLVEAADGTWWAFALGMRPVDGHHLLGRETFLVPMRWEDGWPVLAPGVGQVPAEVTHPAVPDGQTVRSAADAPFVETFTDGLAARWDRLRTAPDPADTSQPGRLRLPLLPATLADPTTPAFVGLRQQHHRAVLTARVEAPGLVGHEQVGVAVRQNDRHHAVAVLRGSGAERVVEVVLTQDGVGERTGRLPLPGDGPVELRLTADLLTYTAHARTDDGAWQHVGDVDGRALSTQTAGGFTGVYLGLYATSDGHPSDAVAEFVEATYTPGT
ncbi:MAG: glycoside hydrolase family 43 protein [Cellulomonas sp.]|uniref:glycoside hydrolase family 43 protein n=1 Tax=Cellulomonas sp. TaxID=40001 RepID=UPI0019F52AEE|nr:glycoside hydrolase family 43 protein [Cellulomonas sp.]MBF0687901.1 glycoside hydrolase family 43 protein [Cellulomonas sp.]